MTTRVGLIGYGVGGRLFHAPYIAASAECDLAGVVTRSPDRADEVRSDHPAVRVFSSTEELWAAGVDAVAISTPPATRRVLVCEAVAAGVAVVADKPFAPTAEDGRALARAADEAGVLLNVFHNRRFDSDIVTARRVIDGGRIGPVVGLDLRCDQDDPSTLEQGGEGGLLRDLGSHVVDQSLHLAGPAVSVTARLDWRGLPAGRTDVGFVLLIDHADGARSVVSSSKLDHLTSRELRLHGGTGSYVSDYRDVQIEAIRRGVRPRETSAWGLETSDRWGVLTTADGSERIASGRGDYTTFYDLFARAVRDGSPGPVPASQGVAVLEVLDAARRSDAEARTIEIAPTIN